LDTWILSNIFTHVNLQKRVIFIVLVLSLLSF